MCFNVFPFYMWLIVKLKKTLQILSSLQHQLQKNAEILWWPHSERYIGQWFLIKIKIVKRKFSNISMLKVYMTLEDNYWVNIINEYLWIIYDTNDKDKLYSHIEDKMSPIWIDLKGRNTVRVFNDLKLKLEYWFMKSWRSCYTKKSHI